MKTVTKYHRDDISDEYSNVLTFIYGVCVYSNNVSGLPKLDAVDAAKGMMEGYWSQGREPEMYAALIEYLQLCIGLNRFADEDITTRPYWHDNNGIEVGVVAYDNKKLGIYTAMNYVYRAGFAKIYDMPQDIDLCEVDRYSYDEHNAEFSIIVGDDEYAITI